MGKAKGYFSSISMYIEKDVIYLHSMKYRSKNYMMITGNIVKMNTYTHQCPGFVSVSRFCRIIRR